jgi:hypothetical protein
VSQKQPVNTREKLCGSLDRRELGALSGSVDGSAQRNRLSARRSASGSAAAAPYSRRTAAPSSSASRDSRFCRDRSADCASAACRSAGSASATCSA